VYLNNLEIYQIAIKYQNFPFQDPPKSTQKYLNWNFIPTGNPDWDYAYPKTIRLTHLLC
jgi:hypothetical protein